MIKNGWLIGVVSFLFLMTSVHAQEKTFTVVIDPGHGGKHPGAKGSLVNEKTITLAVALKLGQLINANHKDVNVIYTRKTDVSVDLSERADIANRNKADLFISIHANAPKNRSQVNVQGAETFTLGLAETEENFEVAVMENSVILMEDNYLQRYGGFDPNSSESYIMFEFVQNKNMEQSVEFASEVQKAFAAAKRVNRGVKQAGFLVLRAISMPGVLIELGFMTNKQEEQYMRSTEGQNQLAKSIYTAFKKYKEANTHKPGVTASTTSPISSTSPISPISSTSPASPTTNSTEGKIVYKVQILTSDKQLPANSPFLKGYKAEWYKDGSLYKYTYGESTDLKTIQTIQKEVSKDFKDAFIIRMKDGRRLK